MSTRTHIAIGKAEKAPLDTRHEGECMNNVPLIIPTPCGYQFAQQIYKHLVKTYLPRRKQTGKGVWVATEMIVFADTDQMTKILHHIRGCDAYIIADMQSAATILPTETIDDRPPSHRISMQHDNYTVYHDDKELAVSPRKVSVPRNFDMLLSVIDATRNAVKENGRITVVLPFFPSSRQDRRGGRFSLDLKRRCVALEKAGADHILTIDVHNESAVENAFEERTGLDNLYARHSVLMFLHANRDMHDASAFKRNLHYAEEFEVGVGFLYKHRTKPNVVEKVLGFGGSKEDIIGKDIYMVDDMIDTAGTIIQAAYYLRECGAKSVRIIATHAVFSPPALRRLDAAHEKHIIQEVIVTNSITHPSDVAAKPWLTIVDVAKYFAKAIDRLNNGESISALLEDEEE